MNIFKHTPNTFFRFVIAGMIALSLFLAPISYTNPGANVAYAQEAVVEVGGELVGTIESMIMDIFSYARQGIQAAYQYATMIAGQSLEQKELFRDGIAWALINMIIRTMISSITDWVRSGFQGSPAFVTDLRGFMVGVLDATVSEFIRGTPLEMLCSPFRLNIQLALQTQYNKARRYRATCGISTIFDNFQQFATGVANVQGGNWSEWFQYTSVASNNQIGASLEARGALSVAMSNAAGKQMKILDFGRGFFSGNRDGLINNPGAVIEKQLNNALDKPGQRLVAADEINELIAEVFSQLVSRILSSGNGLANVEQTNDTENITVVTANGTTNTFDAGNYGQGTATGSAVDDNYWNDVDDGLNDTGITSLTSTYRNSLTSLTDYVENQNQIISMIDTALNYRETNYPDCTETNATIQNYETSFATQRTAASTEITDTNTIYNTLDGYLDDYEALASNSLSDAERIAIFARYGFTSTDTTITVQSGILDTFTAYENANNVPSDYETPNSDYSTTESMSVACVQLVPLPNIGFVPLRQQIACYQDAITLACTPVTTTTTTTTGDTGGLGGGA